MGREAKRKPGAACEDETAACAHLGLVVRGHEFVDVQANGVLRATRPAEGKTYRSSEQSISPAGDMRHAIRRTSQEPQGNKKQQAAAEGRHQTDPPNHMQGAKQAGSDEEAHFSLSGLYRYVPLRRQPRSISAW